MGRRGANSLSSRKSRQRRHRENNQQRLNGTKHHLYYRRPGPKKDLPDKKSAMSGNRYIDDNSRRWPPNRNGSVPMRDSDTRTNCNQRIEPKGVRDREFYNSSYKSTLNAPSNAVYDTAEHRDTRTRTNTSYPRKAHTRLSNVPNAAPDGRKGNHHMVCGTNYPTQTENSRSNRPLRNQFCTNPPAPPADYHSPQYVTNRLAPPNDHLSHVLNHGPDLPGQRGPVPAAYLHTSQPSSSMDPRIRRSQAPYNAPAIPNSSSCVENSTVRTQENTVTSKKGGPINYMRPQQNQPEAVKFPSPLKPGARNLLDTMDSADVSAEIAKCIKQMNEEVIEVSDLEGGDSPESVTKKLTPNRNSYDKIKGIRIKSAVSNKTQNNSSPAIGILTKSQNEAELDKVANSSTSSMVEAQPTSMLENSDLSNKKNDHATPRSESVMSGKVGIIETVDKCAKNSLLEANKKSVESVPPNKNVKAGKRNSNSTSERSIKNLIKESNKKVAERFHQIEVAATKKPDKIATAAKPFKNSSNESGDMMHPKNVATKTFDKNKAEKRSVKIFPKEPNKGSNERSSQIEIVGTEGLDKIAAITRPVKNSSKELSDKMVKKPSKNVATKKHDKNEAAQKIAKSTGSSKKVIERPTENIETKTWDKHVAPQKIVKDFPKESNDGNSVAKNLSNRINENSVKRLSKGVEAKRRFKNVKSNSVAVKELLQNQSEMTSIEPIHIENPQGPDPFESTGNNASKSEDDGQNNTGEKTSNSSNTMTPAQSSLASWLASGKDSEQVANLSNQVKSCMKKKSSLVLNDSNSSDSDASHQPTPATNHEPTSSATPPVAPAGSMNKFIMNLLEITEINIPDDDEDSRNNETGRSSLKIIPKLNSSSTRSRNGKEVRDSPEIIVLDSPSPPRLDPKSNPIVIDDSSDDDVILVEDAGVVEDNLNNGPDDDDLDEELLLEDDYDASSFGSDRLDDILADDLDGEENMDCNDAIHRPNVVRTASSERLYSTEKNVVSQVDVSLEPTPTKTYQNNSSIRPKSDLVTFARLLKRRSSSSDNCSESTPTTPDLSVEKMVASPKPLENSQVNISSKELDTGSEFVGTSSSFEKEAGSTNASEVESNDVDKVEEMDCGMLHGDDYGTQAAEDGNDQAEKNIDSSSTVNNPLAEQVQKNPDSEAHKSTLTQGSEPSTDSLVVQMNSNSKTPKSPEIKGDHDSLKVNLLSAEENCDSEGRNSPVIETNSDSGMKLVAYSDSETDSLENLDDKKNSPVKEENPNSVTCKSPVIREDPDYEEHNVPDVQEHPDREKHNLLAAQNNSDLQNNTLLEVDDKLDSITLSPSVLQNNSDCQAGDLSVVQEVAADSFEGGNVNDGEEKEVSTANSAEQTIEPQPLSITSQFDQLISEYEKFDNESNISEKADASNALDSNGDQALGGSPVESVSLTNTLPPAVAPPMPEDVKTEYVPDRVQSVVNGCANVTVNPLHPCEKICVIMGEMRNTSEDIDNDFESQFIVHSTPVTSNSEQASVISMPINPCKTNHSASRSISFDYSRNVQNNFRKRRSASDGEIFHSNTDDECTRSKLPRMVSEAGSVSLDQPTSSNPEVNDSNTSVNRGSFVRERTLGHLNQMNNVSSDLILPSNLEPPVTNSSRTSYVVVKSSTEQIAPDPTILSYQTVTNRNISSSLQTQQWQRSNENSVECFDGDDSNIDDIGPQIASVTSLSTNQTVFLDQSSPTPQPQLKENDDTIQILFSSPPRKCTFCDSRLKKNKACECGRSNKRIKQEPAGWTSQKERSVVPTSAGTSLCNQAAIPVKVERRSTPESFTYTNSSPTTTRNTSEIPSVAFVSNQNVQQLQSTSQRPPMTGVSTLQPTVNQQMPNNQRTTQSTNHPILPNVSYQTDNNAVQQTLTPSNNLSGWTTVAPGLSFQPQMVNSIPYQQSIPSTTPLAGLALTRQQGTPSYPPPPYAASQTASEITGKQQVPPSTVINYFPVNSSMINDGISRITSAGNTQNIGSATNQCQSAVTNPNVSVQQQQSQYLPGQFSDNVNSNARVTSNLVTVANSCDVANHQNHSQLTMGNRDNASLIGLNTSSVSLNRQTSVDSQLNRNAQQNYVVASSRTSSSYQHSHTETGKPFSSKLPQARKTLRDLLHSGSPAQLQQQKQQQQFQQHQLRQQKFQQQQRQPLQQQQQQQQPLQQQQQPLQQQQQLQQKLQQQRFQQQQRQLQHQPSNVRVSSTPLSNTNAPVPANGYYQYVRHPQNVAFNFPSTGATAVGISSSISTSAVDYHAATRTSTSGMSSLSDSELSRQLRQTAAPRNQPGFVIQQIEANPVTQTSSQFTTNQQGQDCASKRLRAMVQSRISNKTQQQAKLTYVSNSRPSSLSSDCSSQSGSPNETNVLLNNQPKAVNEFNFGFGMIDIRMFAPVIYVKLATITHSPESLRCYCRRHVPYCMLLRQSISRDSVDIPIYQPLIRCKEIIELLQCDPTALYTSVTYANVKSLCRIPYFSTVIDGGNIPEVQSNIDAEAFLTCCISLSDFLSLIFPKFCHDRFGALGDKPGNLFKLTMTKTMQLDDLAKVQKFHTVFNFNNRKFKQSDQMLMVYPPDPSVQLVRSV